MAVPSSTALYTTLAICPSISHLQHHVGNASLPDRLQGYNKGKMCTLGEATAEKDQNMTENAVHPLNPFIVHSHPGRMTRTPASRFFLESHHLEILQAMDLEPSLETVAVGTAVKYAVWRQSICPEPHRKPPSAFRRTVLVMRNDLFVVGCLRHGLRACSGRIAARIVLCQRYPVSAEHLLCRMVCFDVWNHGYQQGGMAHRTRPCGMI